MVASGTLVRKPNANRLSNPFPRIKTFHGRKSTVSTFLSCGFAYFLKLQVNIIDELYNHYEVSSDYDPDPLVNPDPKTDGGGTAEYASWNFGLVDYTTLLEDTMPINGTCRIDLDNDLLFFCDKKNY